MHPGELPLHTRSEDMKETHASAAPVADGSLTPTNLQTLSL